MTAERDRTIMDIRTTEGVYSTDFSGAISTAIRPCERNGDRGPNHDAEDTDRGLLVLLRLGTAAGLVEHLHARGLQ